MKNSFLEENNTKVCSKCQLVKDLLEFSFRTDTRKYREQCMQCTKGYLSSLRLRRLKTKKLLELGKKECSYCHEEKDFVEFSKDKNTPTGFCSRCKKCLIEIRNKNLEKIKLTTACRRYNIDDALYTTLMNEMHCQICGKSFLGITKHIDHCHVTGAIRGVLCIKCNTGLGKLGDSIETLEKAVNYLKSDTYGNLQRNSL